jgi:protein-S-isoprenylcysteine O-methyltransferase Ste14
VTPERLSIWLWGVWVGSWLIAAFFRNRAVARAPIVGETVHRLVTMAGALLLFGFPSIFQTVARWRVSASVGWLLNALILIGLLITWWARVTIGRLWSSDVSRQEAHRVVDSGPYRFVRHPIYTGISLAAFAMAPLRGSVVAVAGAALIAYGLYLKGRLEERFLRKELGAPYDAYARRTPMLIPFVKSSAD